MLTLDKIAKAMETAIDKTRIPANVLPAVLLLCTAMKRPGISATKIAADIISNNESLGIPTDANPDGSPNLINQYTYNVAKCVTNAIKQDGVIQAVIPAGSLMIQVTGANAGGPVTCVGTNLINTTIRGLIR